MSGRDWVDLWLIVVSLVLAAVSYIFWRRSIRDGLTGLYNHNWIVGYLRQRVKEASDESPLSLLVVDLDDFKIANDQNGHAYGDLVLQTVALIIARIVRLARSKNADRVGRYGGEELNLVLPNTFKAAAINVADRLCRTIVEQSQKAGTPITVSIGVATYPYEAHSADDLFRLADSRMYQAKASGKNCVRSDG